MAGIYTFTYVYDIEDKDAQLVEETFEFEYEEGVKTGSHLLTDGVVSIDRIQSGAVEEFSPEYEKLFISGVLEWEEGEPADCNEHRTAIFRCAKCDKLVTFQLSGKHELEDNDDMDEPAKCGVKGKDYDKCAVCGDYVLVAEPAALEHIVVWTVEGVSATWNTQTLTYDINLGTCKATCERTGCGLDLSATPRINQELSKAETCGTDGKVVVEYTYNKEIVAVKEFKLAQTGLHDAVTQNTIISSFEDEYGNKYNAYYCTKCGQFVIID